MAPLLESAMHGLVVGRARRQEMPLDSSVQNPEHGLQDGSGWGRFAARTTVRDVLFEKLLPNPFPLIVAQAKHARAYKDESSGRQLF